MNVPAAGTLGSIRLRVPGQGRIGPQGGNEMAMNHVMDDGATRQQDARQGARSGYMQSQSGREQGRQRSHNALASVRDVVRDTVYTTFDALRGRYDR